LPDSARLYLEAIIGVATMAALSFLSGFAAAAVSGDRTVVIAASAVGFLFSGIVLVVRLWRMAHAGVAG
jgi:hypothetical protein